MKKKVAILAAGVLLVSSAAGCGTENVQKISEDMQKSVKEVKSAMGDVDMGLGVTIGQSGISMGIDMGLQGDWEAVLDPGAFHFNGTMSMSLLKFSMDMELYGVEEDDKMILYAKVGDEWNKSETDLDKPEDRKTTKNLFDEDYDRIVLDEKTEKVNGKDAYVMRTTITGEDVKKAVNSVGDMMEEELTEDNLEGISLDDLEADVVLKVYKEDKLPAFFSFELKDGIKDLNPEHGENEPEIGIDNCTFTANIKEYNNIDKIEIPEEALTAKDSSNEELLEDFQKGLTGQESGGTGTAGENGSGVAGEAAAGTDAQGAEDEPDGSLPEGETQGNDQEPLEPDSLVDGQNAPKQNADGSYAITDYANEASVDIMVPDGFKEDYMNSSYFAFSKENTGDDSYVSASYTIVGMSEYYTEDDYIDTYLAQQDDYEEYGYQSIKCDGPGSFTVDGKTISYITVDYSFGNDSDNRQIIFWTKLDETHLLECILNETVYEKGLSIKADEETAKMLFSGVSL